MGINDERKEVVLTVRERRDGTFHYSLHRYVEAGSLSLPTAGRQAQGPVAPPALDGAPDSLNIELFRAPGNLTETFAHDAEKITAEELGARGRGALER